VQTESIKKGEQNNEKRSRQHHKQCSSTRSPAHCNTPAPQLEVLAIPKISGTKRTTFRLKPNHNPGLKPYIRYLQWRKVRKNIPITQRPHARAHNLIGHTPGVHNKRTYIKEYTTHGLHISIHSQTTY